MKRGFSLTPAARLDLIEISEYLRQKSPSIATRVLAELRSAMRQLAVRPAIGHLREDLANEKVRFWPVYSYLIIYRAQTQPLQVIRVLHGSRDIRKLLGA